MTNIQAGEGIQLSTTPVHFAAGGGATTIGDFTFDPPGFAAYIAARTTAEDPGRLVFVEHSADSWGMWECHPVGDEMVIVISGVAQFIQEIDGGGGAYSGDSRSGHSEPGRCLAHRRRRGTIRCHLPDAVPGHEPPAALARPNVTELAPRITHGRRTAATTFV